MCLSLSHIAVNPDSAKAGDVLFHSETAACYYCHGADAKGRQVIGSTNLTDNIWLWANVPAANTIPLKEAAVENVIRQVA